MKKLLLAIIGTGLLLSPLALAGEVNINTADAQQIASELKGVGLSKAEAIVKYRETNGEFETADDLARVKGIGLRTVDLNRDNIKVNRSKSK